ncbi:DUF3884 family protein [Streptococcus intermedius]|uniref:DUF3884 family protein n=1 Tax=Streptococcus intermedius TaxID=1338 RepID=UPI0021ADB6D7|nr:DUF3884 family protein [Streptococcus intermedius]
MTSVLSSQKSSNLWLSEPRKWYTVTGKEWICHSDLEIKEFESLFLNLLNDELKETAQFEVDYMSFQQG